jgi:hypothetical protein
MARTEAGSLYERLIKQGTDSVTYLNGSVLPVETVELGDKVIKKTIFCVVINDCCSSRRV